MGPITLRWYGFFAALGFLCAYFVFRKRAARIGLSDQDVSNVMFLMFITGILGARLYYVILNWKEEYANHLSEIVMINHGGLVFFGGFIMAFAALYLWARMKKVPLAPLADALAIPLAIGHAFGRLGCFMNGCCYGKDCTLPWAVQLSFPPEIAGRPIHPTQLYEFFGIWFIVLGLIGIEKIPRYKGQVAGTYCLLYSVLRFIVEFYRGDVPHNIMGRFTLAQVVCIFVFIAAWLVSARLSFKAAQARRRTAKGLS